MRRRLLFLVLSIVIVRFAGPFDARASAASIPVPSQLLMNVRETAGVARSGEVVRSGVPIPRSLNVLSTAGLAVVDSAGQPVTAEMEITARWNAGKTVATAPAQWLLVTFPVTVGANQTATYRLVTDGAVANPSPARPLTLTRGGNAVTVDTGAAVFRLGAGSSALFDEVVAANGARLIGGGNLSLRTGGANYGHSTTRKVTIEHQGPLTAIVVVQGTYDVPAIGGGDISTRRRYVFTAGSPTAIVRHVTNWEGALACEGCVSTSTGGVNGVLVEKLRDDLAVDLGGAPTVTALGNFAAPAVAGPVGADQSAWVRQQLRPTRASPLAFDVNVAGATAAGAKADGALLAATGSNGTVAISLGHMHRYEPEALRLLPGGRLAVDVVDDKAWIANHQGLFATLAVTATPGAPSRAELNRMTWAPLNRPLHAWAEPRWLASSDALDEFPVGALPADLAGYDTLVTSVLSRTVSKIDSDGLNGLMTFGVYPRYWGKDNEVGEVECGADGDPTPAEAWDNTFWCGAWTDYHNTVSTATIWAFRTGDVEWLDEISFPGALRTLHTQMMQCGPANTWFYCGQSPTGYGAYRTDFNSSHAYFENLYLYYWLTGDQTVTDILQRGGDNMRRWVCPLRLPNGGGSACPADYPVKIEASLTGRVGQQWQAAFRFLGQASDDASFLDDFRSGYARAATQQYARSAKNGTFYGFWGGPALQTTPGTYQTDSQWTIGMYDMHYLDRLAKDTGDAAIGIPALRPSEVISSIAHTYKDLEPVVIGDGTVSGLWARLLEYNWSGDRLNGTLNSVIGADRELYNPEKTGAAEVLIRAGQREGNAALVDFGRKLTVFTISAAQGENAPLGKLMGQDLTRLHPAVALLTNPGSGTTTPPPPPPPPPPSPTAPAAPSNLTGSGTSASEVTLAWQDNSGDEASFRVEQLVGSAYQEIQTLAAGAVTAKVAGLAAGTAYTFRVRAANAAGFSAYSNPVTTATQSPPPPPPSPVPAAPSNLAGQATGPGDVTLTWLDNSDNEASFRVERSINGVFQEIQTVGANVTTAQVSGLAAGSTHLFRVRAANGSGFSAYSNTATVVTPMTPPTASPPAAPTKLNAQTASATEIQLTWRDNSTNEASFRIERKVGGAYQEILTVAANVTTVKVGGLAPSTAYSFRVRAANTGGFSSYSNVANATTKAAPAVAPLAAPTMTSIRDLGSGAAQVTWKDNSTNETQFQVERMVNGVYQTAATVSADATTTRVTGLRSRASYTFRVKVTDGLGQVAYSSPMNINTN
ncbi:MAG: fibronectin type III domain-containing protein [Thermoanaerobaculia bacterium]